MKPLNYAQNTVLKLMGWSFLSTSAFWVWVQSQDDGPTNGLLVVFIFVGLLLLVTHGIMAIVIGSAVTRKVIFSGRIKHKLKRLNERVRLSEQIKEHITEFILEGLIIIDRESRIIFVNKMACQILRLSKNVSDVSLIEAIREPEIHEIISEVLKTAERVERTITLSSMDQRKLLVRVSPMKNHHLLIALWDTTRASTIDEMQTDFLAHASHELKTPISVILANAELIIDSPHLNATDRPLMNAIHRQALRAKILLDSLLELFRLDAGRNPVALESVDLREFVDYLRESIGELGTAIVNEVPARICLFTDRKLLERLALIIIENTKKYAGPKATLWIKIQQQKNALKLQFADNGPGIKRHLRERVFERFFRQPEHDRSESGGFGLGLAQAKAIATTLGAQIFVEQEKPNMGCMIVVVFQKSSEDFYSKRM